VSRQSKVNVVLGRVKVAGNQRARRSWVHINQSLKHTPSKELILTGNRIFRVGPCQPIIITSRYEWWAHYYWVSLKPDGPHPSTIYCFMLRAHGPIHIESRSEWWAHTLNIYSVLLGAYGPILSMMYLSRLEHMGPFILNYAINDRPILSIVTLGVNGPMYMHLHFTR
jgi:hypothetical protein